MQRKIRSTTILCVRRNGKVVIAGDGQVTMGSEVLKSGARKLRRFHNGKIISGFAGSTADAFSLFTRFEAKLEQHSGNLSRSVVELAKDWRTDKMLRHLEALLGYALFERMVNGGESFWSAVYAPFMSRDLTRDDVRAIVRRGLERTGGNYRVMVELFNMPIDDYKRFLGVLRKYQCHMPFQQFRSVAGTRPSREQAGEAPQPIA